MTRKLALVAGVLFTAGSAGSLLAQTSPATKPTNPSAQHAVVPSQAKPTQQDSVTAHAAPHTKMKHAAWTKDQIKDAQEGLAKAGFYKGQPTGVVDRKTRKAIREYQKANKLPVTGHLNNDLLTRLHTS